MYAFNMLYAPQRLNPHAKLEDYKYGLYDSLSLSLSLSLYIYIYIYICVCVCIYIYIYIYTYAHTKKHF